jgi:hypothetical protein
MSDNCRYGCQSSLPCTSFPFRQLTQPTSPVTGKAIPLLNGRKAVKHRHQLRAPDSFDPPTAFGPDSGNGIGPGEGIPGEGIPGEGIPGEGTPGEGIPGEGIPGEGIPGEGIPGIQARHSRAAPSRRSQPRPRRAPPLAWYTPGPAHILPPPRAALLLALNMRRVLMTRMKPPLACVGPSPSVSPLHICRSSHAA